MLTEQEKKAIIERIKEEAKGNIAKELELYLLFGIKPERKEKTKDLKYAYVLIDGKHASVGIDPETNKAYKLGEGYDFTDEEIPEYEFVRWMRIQDF